MAEHLLVRRGQRALRRFSVAFQGRCAMAKKPENPTGAEGGAGKPGGRGQGRQPKQSGQQSKQHASPTGRTQAVDGSPPPRVESRWRPLAAATLGIEAFCKEVARFAANWPDSGRITDKDRKKAAADCGRLADYGTNARDRVLYFNANCGGEVDASEADDLATAWHRLQGVDLVARLQAIIDKLQRTERRLRHGLSDETREKLNEDFRTLAQEVDRFNALATQVRESLTLVADESYLDPTFRNLLMPVIAAITKAITGTTDGTSDTWMKKRVFANLLSDRIDRAAQIRRTYVALRDRLNADFNDKMKAKCFKDEKQANRFTVFLERLGSVLHTVHSAEEFATQSEAAAMKGIEDTVPADAKALENELHALRLEFRMLGEVIWKYRDIIARAPFKRVRPPKPMPPWEYLKEREQQAIAVLITQRAKDPNGAMYSMSRKDIERSLGLADNDATLNRLLGVFDEEYAIVGKYQPIRSIDEQRPAFGYWIEEYAYVAYGAHVLGDAWVPPTDP